MNSGARTAVVTERGPDLDSLGGAARDESVLPGAVGAFLEAQRKVPSASVVAKAAGRHPVPRALRKSYRVAQGEVAVLEVLSQLGPNWLVRTCESAGEGGFEHLLIGPAGIFCLITRPQLDDAIWIDGGTMLAGGERIPHLRDAEFSAVRATQLMSDAIGARAEATPCLVLIGSRSMTVSKPPRRVAVMTPRDIRGWLKGLPTVLGDEELKALQSSAAVHPGLFTLGEAGSRSARELDEFRRIRAEVAQARHVRLTWVTGALVLVWLLAVAGTSGVTTDLLFN